MGMDITERDNGGNMEIGVFAFYSKQLISTEPRIFAFQLPEHTDIYAVPLNFSVLPMHDDQSHIPPCSISVTGSVSI